jgi:DNA-nicking Smr family endonuclease
VDEDRPVPLPIEDSIDLHAFAPGDVASVVEEYVRAAAAAGFREVRIIHGKGIGVQREAVRRVLERSPFVTGWSPAPEERGSWGATLARLAPYREPPGPDRP